MKADKFNEYLVHDGVSDMLKWRKENNALDKDAVEQYWAIQFYSYVFCSDETPPVAVF